MIRDTYVTMHGHGGDWREHGWGGRRSEGHLCVLMAHRNVAAYIAEKLGSVLVSAPLSPFPSFVSSSTKACSKPAMAHTPVSALGQSPTAHSSEKQPQPRQAHSGCVKG